MEISRIGLFLQPLLLTICCVLDLPFSRRKFPVWQGFQAISATRAQSKALMGGQKDANIDQVPNLRKSAPSCLRFKNSAEKGRSCDFGAYLQILPEFGEL